MPLPYFSFPT